MLDMVPHPVCALHKALLVHVCCIASLAESVSVLLDALYEPLIEQHHLLVQLTNCGLLLLLRMLKLRLSIRTYYMNL